MRPPMKAAVRRLLTPSAREVLRLRFGGPTTRPYAEVAQLLGISVAGVKRIEERALQALRVAALESEAAPLATPGGSDAAKLVRLRLSRSVSNDWDEV